MRSDWDLCRWWRVSSIVVVPGLVLGFVSYCAVVQGGSGCITFRVRLMLSAESKYLGSVYILMFGRICGAVAMMSKGADSI